MKRLMNLLRGTVALCVTGPFPERLLNLCAQHRLDFWRLVWLDDHTVRFTARRSQFRRLEALAERVDCRVEVEQRRGLPDFLLRFRARYAFLAGLALALGAVAFLSRFVLTIQVSGNERLPTAVILSQLRQLGVYPGVYGPGIDRQQVAQEAQLALDDLAWMGINLHGTRLEVSVRVTIPPAAGRRLRLWGCEPEGRWEQTSSAHQAALPGVGRLPITLRRETWREYTLTSVPLNREAAQTLLQQRLLVHLKDVIGPEGELVTADYAAQVEGGSLKVILQAECREEIGRERETGAITDGLEPEENDKTGRAGENT